MVSSKFAQQYYVTLFALIRQTQGEMRLTMGGEGVKDKPCHAQSTIDYEVNHSAISNGIIGVFASYQTTN